MSVKRYMAKGNIIRCADGKAIIEMPKMIEHAKGQYVKTTDYETLQKECESLRKENEWISVDDRLPDIIGDYLVCNKSRMYWSFFNSVCSRVR